MNLPRVAVHRPIFTSMVVMIVVLLGGFAFVRLPIDLLPEITSPTVSIVTRYENVGAPEIEELITRPIEEAVGAVPGVDEITSTSTEGVSNVRVSFAWGQDLDAAANDIRDRLDRVNANLPEESERPYLRKYDLASFPILMLGSSSRLDPVQMRMILDNEIQYRIERLDGVASVTTMGGRSREIHVNLYYDKIKALGLPLNALLSRLRAENINLPAGVIQRGQLEVALRTPGEFTDIEQIRNTVAAIRDGVPIQFKEIASVEEAWEDTKQIVRVNGEPGVRMMVYKQSGKNSVEVARRVFDELKRINADYPQLNLIPTMDTSDYITRSISNLGHTTIYGGFLAIFVLLFFLGNLRSTIIIATAIPVSIIATFALMYFYGYTLNIMTMGGLALGVGMLVDCAIVVLENIFRLKEQGFSTRKAAVEGTGEVTAAIIAGTLTTLVVFLPMVFMEGMSGVMFVQLAIIVSFSLICSTLVALTLVPMLTVKSLESFTGAGVRFQAGGQFKKWMNVRESVLRRIGEQYEQMLQYCLEHRMRVSMITLAALLLSLTVIPLIGVEFMPKADEGEVEIQVEMAVGTRVEMVDNILLKISDMVMPLIPEARYTTTRIGGSDYRGTATHKGDLEITLVPLSERTRSTAEIAASLRPLLSNIPGAVVRVREGGGLFIFRMISGGTEAVQIEIRGHDFDQADALAQEIADISRGVPGVTDVVISRESGRPEEWIMIDRQKAAQMKLNVSQVAQSLQTILTGTQAGYFHEGGEEYVIRVQVKDAKKLDSHEILDLSIANADGEPVVLRNIVQVNPQIGPVIIERQDQERVVRVSANLEGRDMGSVIADVREQLRELPIPRDFSIAFAGDYEEQQEAFLELLFSFVFALILVYMVMACQYESYRDPFVVMFSIPFSIIGVVLALLLTNTTFNVQSFIGCIVLAGIVVNNAILLVDHTNLLRRRDGMEMYEAIREAGRRRLRPVLMTAGTAILGLLPLAIGLEEGSETQAPMARTVVGGLLSSTFITLLLVPVMYSFFEKEIDDGALPIGVETDESEDAEDKEMLVK